MSDLWETFADIEGAARRSGRSVSKAQIERWRYRGLLPKVAQVGKGRGAGSEVRYPVGTADQCVAIIKLLSIKEKFDYVGWHLWMRGYDVADEYWKPATVSALGNLGRIPAFLRLMEMRNRDQSQTIFDQIDPRLFRKTPFMKGLAKLPRELATLSLGLMADIAKGEFSRNRVADPSELVANQRAVIKLIGLSAKSGIPGTFLSYFEEEIETQLEALSRAMGEIRNRHFPFANEITPQVRSEFTTVLDVAGQLASVNPIIAKSPIGRFAKAIADDKDVQAHCIIVWSAFRKMGTIMENNEIISMAQNLTSELDKSR